MPNDPLDPVLAKLLLEQGQVIEQLRAELAERDAKVAAQAAKNLELQAELEHEKFKVRKLLHQLYGVKSERLDPLSYQLLIEGMQPPAVAPVVVDELAEEREERRSGGGRKALPAHLPVKVTIIDLPEAERVGLIKIREEVTEQLERAPARHYVHRIIRYVYAVGVDESVALIDDEGHENRQR